MFNITLYNFKKNENSTARPSSDGTVLPCRILSDSSIIKPAVEISRDVNCIDYNYAYIPEFNRYFWIRDVKFQETKWVLFLECDVLATYKTEIGATNLYVLRASATYNGRITDNYYMPLAQCSTNVQLQTLGPPTPNFNTGFFLVNVMGTMGASTYAGAQIIYQFTPANFRALIRELYTAINGYSGSDVVSWICQKWGGNPTQLISGVVWVPYTFKTETSIPINDVVIGGYNTGVSGTIINVVQIDLPEYTFNVVKHPKTVSKGTYLNVAPFSQYNLYLNCGGSVMLDSTKLIDDTVLTVKPKLDVKGTLHTTVIGNNSNFEYAHLFGKMGVDISLNGNDSGGAVISGIASTVIGGVSAYATGGASLAVLGATASGAGTIANSIGGASSNTASGAIAGINKPSKLTSVFYDIPSEDNARNGRPLCAIRTPASLGGFMMVQRGDVEIDGTFEEMLAIKNFLERGFYYE